MRGSFRAVLAACVAVFSLMVSYNAVEAALPYYTRGDVSYVWASLALSMVYLFITLSNPLAGYLTGVFSLRRLMVAGSLGYAFFIASVFYSVALLLH